MFFKVKEGYCRCDGRKCRHLKVKEGVGYCKREIKYRGKHWSVLRNEKTGYPKNISSDRNIDIRAPKWCPKL